MPDRRRTYRKKLLAAFEGGNPHVRPAWPSLTTAWSPPTARFGD